MASREWSGYEKRDKVLYAVIRYIFNWEVKDGKTLIYYAMESFCVEAVKWLYILLGDKIVADADKVSNVYCTNIGPSLSFCGVFEVSFRYINKYCGFRCCRDVGNGTMVISNYCSI